ncbi:MAG: hypothetical protein ACK51V_02895 [bacterium]|jgi:hypothetical protein|nr:hypothetical protein [Betaproteobacteria bacterium]
MNTLEKPVIPRPLGVCTACQERGHFVTYEAGAVSTYCPHHKTGALGRPQTSDGEFVWSMVSPVSAEAWDETLLSAQGPTSGRINAH